MRPRVLIPGLWGLSFGNGSGSGDTKTLYFAAGIPGPTDAIASVTVLAAAVKARPGSPFPAAGQANRSTGGVARGAPSKSVLRFATGWSGDAGRS